MKPVSPRLTLYLAQKGDSEFHPVMLQEVTVSELLKNISDIVEVNNDDSVVSGRIFVCYCRLQMDYLTKFWWRAPTILVSG